MGERAFTESEFQNWKNKSSRNHMPVLVGKHPLARGWLKEGLLLQHSYAYSCNNFNRSEDRIFYIVLLKEIQFLTCQGIVLCSHPSGVARKPSSTIYLEQEWRDCEVLSSRKMILIRSIWKWVSAVVSGTLNNLFTNFWIIAVAYPTNGQM